MYNISLQVESQPKRRKKGQGKVLSGTANYLEPPGSK